MKKNIGTFFWLAIILAGVFFIIKTAFGLVVITGEDIFIEYNPLSGGFPLCQSFKLETTGTTTIEDLITRGYYNDSWNSENWTHMGLYGPYDTQLEADTAFGRFGSCHDHFEKEIIWESQVTMPIDVLGDIIWEINTELTGGKWFYVHFGISAIGPAYIAGTANGYTEGALAIRTGGDLNGATQIALSLNLVPPPPSDTIEIIYPTTTPPYDFSNWIVAFTTATSTTATSTDYYIKEVFVGSTTSTIVNLSGGASFGESPLDVPNNLIFNPNYLYYAQARLIYYVAPNFNLVATSSIISFTPSFETETEIEVGLYPIPTSTATSSLWTMTCDPESGFFQNSLCNLARFLFVPTQLSVRNLTDLKAEIELKPPIGYFKLIKDALINLDYSGFAAFTLVGVEGLETGLLDKIKDILSIIFYLIFGFWLLKRLINFDFHL